MPRKSDIILRQVLGATLQDAAIRMVLILGALAGFAALVGWLVIR